MRKALVSMLLAFLPGLCLAQNESATLSGRVSDPIGAAVVGAEVVLTNVDTNVEQRTKTNSAGLYVFTGVHSGTYRVAAGSPGFKTLIKENLTLHVQDEIAENFSLSLGAVAETVTVNANDIHLNTTDGSVGTVVDQSYVANMPLNGRSFQDLILLTPGVVTQPPNGETILGIGGEFSVNGQRTDSNYYSVDGVSANIGATAGSDFYNFSGASGSLTASTALGTTQALVSVDALQEFRVQSSSYSAEYGRNPGGQFSLVTRSGTNQWHGTAFEYLRNDIFDANTWFNDYLNAPQGPLRQNDFGGTLGGPIRIPPVYNGKDRTFFFFSYEGLRLIQPQEATVNPVPTLALRASVPSPLQPVLNAFPLPHCPTPPGACTTDLGNGFGDFVGAWSNPSALDSYSVRFDHALNDKLGLFFRFSDTPSHSDARLGGHGLPPSQISTSQFTARTYTFGLNSAFTNRLSNGLRLNYSSNEVISATKLDAFGGSTPTDLATLQGVGNGSQIGVVFILPGTLSFVSQRQISGVQRQWNFVDTVGLSVGRHQFTFGVDYRRLSPTAAPATPFAQYTYFSQAQINANKTFGAIGITNAAAYPLYKNFSVLAQDQWKIRPRLSLSMGLRWEVNPAPGVTQGLLPYTLQGSSLATLTLVPQGTRLWKTSWFNFAPRVGIAYVLRDKQGSETVVRAGGGVFFDTGQQLGSLGFGAAGFSAGKFILGVPFPEPAAILFPNIVNPPLPKYFAVYFSPHLQLPYTLQWNGSVQQALGTSQTITVSYVGSHAAKLLRESTYSGVAIGNPNLTNLVINDNGLTSYYGALQVQYQRRVSRGLTALASYTWSHCIDYGSTNIVQGFVAIAYLRGNCDFDVRHNVNTGFSYDFPRPFHNGFARALLHNWGFDNRFTARTGFPVTLQGASIADPVTGQLYSTNLDFVPGQPIYVYGSQCAAIYNNGLGCPGGRAINPNAFALPAPGVIGNAPRNFARGFGAWQMNMAVRREFPIYERLKLQFRAEAFNIFNHPNFGQIDQFFGQKRFGQAIGTLAGTLGVLSPLYQTGGPRSMQFALKLVF